MGEASCTASLSSTSTPASLSRAGLASFSTDLLARPQVLLSLSLSPRVRERSNTRALSSFLHDRNQTKMLVDWVLEF